MSSSQSILHAITQLDAYGGSRMLCHLATRQVESSATVAVAAFTADPHAVRELRDAGVEVHVLHSRGRWDVVAPARLRRLATRSNVGVLHAWDARALALTTLTRRRRAASPCVATLSHADVSRSWSRRIIMQARRSITGFAASDEATHAWLFDAGVDAALVSMIPPGVAAPAQTVRCRADVLNELAVPLDAPLIAVVSPLVRSKQLDETIWHFELLRVLYPQARLLFVGDGPDRPRLRHFALQVSDAEAVRFLGYRTAPADLLSHVDAYWQLNPSQTTPWALLEAMAVGAPIVAADVPAHRAVVASLVEGGLVPLNDRAAATRATDRLLADPASARQASWNAAMHVAAQYSIETAFCAYESLYHNACSGAFADVGNA